MSFIYSVSFKVASSAIIGKIIGDDTNLYIGIGDDDSGSLLQARKNSWDCRELGTHEQLVQGICGDTDNVYTVGYDGKLK